MWVTSRTGSVGWDLRKVRAELSSCLRTRESSLIVGRRRLTFGARRGLAAGAHVMVVVGGADGKVVIERLCLSLPYVEKPFNSKVIKSFVPELRSRKCFSCFEIPMLSIYELWTYYVTNDLSVFMGLMKILVVVGYWYQTPLVSSYRILIHWRLLVYEGC